MASQVIKKIKVYIRTLNDYYPAIFQKCLLSQLYTNHDCEKLEINVDFNLENDQLVLQLPKESTLSHPIKSYKLKHPPFCPIYHLSTEDLGNMDSAIINQGVDVGVASLFESVDGLILMTRRAPHMRTFPGVWVPPGGHVESKETIEEAAFREFFEETGIEINDNKVQSCHVLGLWESVFPPLLSFGTPKRHHVVIYLHVKLNQTKEEIQSQLKLDPNEVDACAWLDEELINIVVHGSDKPLERKFHITLVNENGDQVAEEIDAEMIKQKIPAPGVDTERISTGTRYALSLWLESVSSKIGKSSL